METTSRPSPLPGFSYCQPRCYCKNCKLVERDARAAVATSAAAVTRAESIVRSAQARRCIDCERAFIPTARFQIQCYRCS